jgi:hypothetical protein
VFTGNGNGLSSIVGANVTGTVANATYATSAGTAGSATSATNAAALLTTLTTTGTVFIPFISATANGNYAHLSNANFSANLANGAITATTFVGALSGAATSATTAGTVTTNAQPNITSTGTLTSLAVTGNISAGNVSATTFTGSLSGAATSATTAGTVTTNAQPNITSVGTLANLDVTGNIIGNVAWMNGVVFGLSNSLANFNVAQSNVGRTVGIKTNAAVYTDNGGAGTTAMGAIHSLVAPTVQGVTFSTTYTNLATLYVSNAPTIGGSITVTNRWALYVGGGSSYFGGNVTGANLITSGLISASGNITGANVIATAYHIRSVGTGITGTGTTQGTGTVLSKEINIVSTVAAGANAVVLPTAVTGMVVTVTNTTANTMLVFPAAGAQINSLGANISFSQSTTTIQFIAPSSTQWYTVGATYA